MRERDEVQEDEPMNITSVLEQAQCDGMDGCVAPSLVEEPSRSVQMIEVIFIRLTSPKLHVGDLEVGPEMTRRVAVRLPIVLGPPVAVLQPVHRVVGVYVFRVRGEELHGLGPQGRDALGRIVQVDGEAEGLVVVFHVAEDVVVDVAEEVHFRLHAPVVPGVGEGGVFVEHAAVPATHLVVGHEVAVLHVLLFKHLGRFLEEVVVYPRGDRPVVFGDCFCESCQDLLEPQCKLPIRTIVTFRFGFGLSLRLEFVRKGFVVEESPWIVELAIPCPL